MQYNTYYQKLVWDKFKDEPEKSKLVNQLLLNHYRIGMRGAVQGVVGNEIGRAPGLLMNTTEELECCQATRPCKHWHFDGQASTWTNDLSGRVKEVAV